MKVSNTIKKMVVLSVFCSQTITLLPMQLTTEARPTRGLSLLSMNSDATLTLPTGEVPVSEEPRERDPKAEHAARQTRLNTLFYGERDAIINIPRPDQDEQDPANLDESIKAAIAQDADKDQKLVAARDERQATLVSLGLHDDVEQGTLPTGVSSIALDSRTQAIISAPTQADADAKIEQVQQETNKINKLIEDTKQLMSRAKGHLVKGLERGAYLIVAANIVMIAWSTIDTARNTETLPYLVYVADGALIVLTATAEIFHGLYNKLKQEVEVDDELIPENQPSRIPQPAMSYRQQFTSKLSNYWSNVTNCLSKIAGTHLITGIAVASAGVTFTAARWPEAISPTAAEWIDNGENILDGLIIGWLVFSKTAVNKLYALRAKKEAQRRASDDGIVHKKIELNTLADRRPSLKPQDQVHITPTHGTKGSLEMVIRKEGEIVMVANPLVMGEPMTITTGEKTKSNTSTPEKGNTPKRDSSEESTPDLTIQKKLDFKVADATRAELAV